MKKTIFFITALVLISILGCGTDIFIADDDTGEAKIESVLKFSASSFDFMFTENTSNGDYFHETYTGQVAKKGDILNLKVHHSFTHHVNEAEGIDEANEQDYGEEAKLIVFKILKWDEQVIQLERTENESHTIDMPYLEDGKEYNYITEEEFEAREKEKQAEM